MALRPLRSRGRCPWRPAGPQAVPREDGLFYFKLQVGDAEPLLQSLGFADPKACGACIGSLKADPQGWAAQQAFLQPVPADRQPAVVAALQQLAEG